MGKMSGRTRRRGSLTRHILKMLTLFGSVEAMTMLCSLVRNKFMALWTGATGLGLLGLYSNTIEMLTTSTQMGIRTASVPGVAGASEGEERAASVAAVRRLGVLLALAGGILTIVLAPLLSELSFGSKDYSWAFMVLAVAVFLSAVNASEAAVLQGTGLLKRLAKITAWSALSSLILSAAIIYLWRIEGIIPMIMTVSVTTAIFTCVYHLRGCHPLQKAGWRETLCHAKEFIRLGLFITLSGLLATLSNYLFMSWLNRIGGEAAMGYYQAGTTVAVRYVGIVFTAIAVEYYPRLAATRRAGSGRMSMMLRHESGLVLKLLIPAAWLMTVAAPWIVKILYSGDFERIVPMVVMASPGIVARGIAWCTTFVLLARGNGRAYFMLEASSTLLGFALNIAGYAAGGLEGLGVSFSVWYLLYAVMSVATVRRVAGISPSAITLWWGAGGYVLTALTGSLCLFLW